MGRWQAFRRLPRAVRWTAWTAVGLVLVLLVVAAAVVAVVRRPLPQTNGEATLPGLTASVEVLRDDHDIPQLYADNDADLMRAQGYVHAQERFFEMDFRRHVTAGRLSELFGPDTLETDKFIRTMDWRGVAEQEWALLQPATREALTAYAEGVNAYLDERSGSELATEYAVLGPDRARLHAREVGAGRLAGLAQGDGVGPARQHGRGGRPGAAVGRPHARGDRRAVAGVPLRRAPADRLRRRRRGRRLRAERDGQRHPQPPPTGVPARVSSQRSSACRTRSPRCPT